MSHGNLAAEVKSWTELKGLRETRVQPLHLPVSPFLWEKTFPLSFSLSLLLALWLSDKDTQGNRRDTQYFYIFKEYLQHWLHGCATLCSRMESFIEGWSFAQINQVHLLWPPAGQSFHVSCENCLHLLTTDWPYFAILISKWLAN